ncbi:MAG: hypothetical protein MZV70_64130 [Desulfobacterales bacterium]|nr:hypothetical protein [Desulfobacterales bacterium]
MSPTWGRRSASASAVATSARLTLRCRPESTIPAAIGKTTDLADAAHGDTIDIDGVTYYVQEIMPGDDGFTRLLLSGDSRANGGHHRRGPHRMQGIGTTGGYGTDAGANVTEWRTRPAAPSELLGIDIRDISVSQSDEPGAIGSFRWDMVLEVEVFAQAHPATIRSMIADVIKAIGADIFWGGLAVATYQPDDAK